MLLVNIGRSERGYRLPLDLFVALEWGERELGEEGAQRSLVLG